MPNPEILAEIAYTAYCAHVCEEGPMYADLPRSQQLVWLGVVAAVVQEVTRPRVPVIGEHVLYLDAKGELRDALVSRVCTATSVDLAFVRDEGAAPEIATSVQHISITNDAGAWFHPEEVEEMEEPRVSSVSSGN